MTFIWTLAGVALAAQISSTPVVAVPNPAVAAGEPGLVGTWKLLRFENRLKDGTVEKPYGEHPRGYFVYDATGHLHIGIMKYPPVPAFAGGEDNATDAEKARAFDAYGGYFGTYRVDKVNHVLHHQVEGALNTTYTDTDQLRPYKLQGDTLIIELDDPANGTHYYRQLRRVM